MSRRRCRATGPRDPGPAAATPGLETINGPLVEKATEIYLERNIDFIDGYIAAVMQEKRIDGNFSYDRKRDTTMNRKQLTEKAVSLPVETRILET